MIVNIQGTSGSGKTTLVRRIMDLYAVKEPVYQPGRKRPAFYKLWQNETWKILKHPPDLIVVGSYETTCGGCDTITSTDLVFDLVTDAQPLARHVLFEGLLISGGVHRYLRLGELFGNDTVQVVALSTPVEVCLASVNARRSARDPDLPPVNPKNTESKWGGVQSAVRRLREANLIKVYELSRDDAFEHLKEIFT